MKIEADRPERVLANLRGIEIDPETDAAKIKWSHYEGTPGGGVIEVVEEHTYTFDDPVLRGITKELHDYLVECIERDEQQPHEENSCETCTTQNCCSSDFSEPLWLTQSDIEMLELDDDQVCFLGEGHWAGKGGGSWDGNDDPACSDIIGYMVRDPWCPLLENGKCSKYGVRPLSCRLGPERNCGIKDLDKET